jgi:hypothetical protein
VVAVVNPYCTDCRKKRRVAKGVQPAAIAATSAMTATGIDDHAASPECTGRDEDARADADDRGHRNDTVPLPPQSVRALPTSPSLPTMDEPEVDAELAKIVQRCQTLNAHSIAHLKAILSRLEQAPPL